MDGNSSRARGWLPHRTEATRSCPRRRRTALLRRWLRRADGWPEACVGLRRRSVLGPRRRRGCPNRDGATPVGSGGRGKGRPSPRRGGRRRVRRGRRICGGSIRRESGGRREEHREKVPWCFHHAPTESFPHLSPPAGLKRKLRQREPKCRLTTSKRNDYVFALSSPTTGKAYTVTPPTRLSWRISLKERLSPNRPRRSSKKIWANRRAFSLSSSRQTICSLGTWSFIRGLPLGLTRSAGSSIAPITATGMPRKPLGHCSNMASRRCTCIGSSLPVNLKTLLRGGSWRSWACDERPTFESASGVRTMRGGTNTSMPFSKKSGSRPTRHN